MRWRTGFTDFTGKIMKRIGAKIASLPPAVKASTALLLASVAAKGIAYLATPFYTRLLSAEEYGQASIFFTWMQLLGVFATFNLSAGVFNNGMVDHPDRRDEYAASMLALSNLLTLLVMAVVIVTYPLTKQWLDVDFELICLMGLIFLLEPAYSFWVSRQRYEFKYKASTLFAILLALLSPACAILAILAFPEHRLFARLFGAELPLLAAYAGFHIYIAAKGRRPDTSYWKQALLFNLPLIPHYLSMHMLSGSDRIMIANLIGPSEAAYYSVAYAIASVPSILWSAINVSLVPITYESCKRKSYGAISRAAMPALFLFAGACLALILFAPELVGIMATADYLEAVYVVPPVIGGVFFQAQYVMCANVIYYFKRPRYVMYASVTATICNLLLNFVFIRRFGYLAAGYTTLACYLLQAAMDYFAMRKVAGGDVYHLKQLAALSATVLLISLASNVLYRFAAIRYAAIGVLAILCFAFRRSIRGALGRARQ